MKIIKSNKDRIIDENIAEIDRLQKDLYEKRLAHCRERLLINKRVLEDDEETSPAERDDADMMMLDKYIKEKEKVIQASDVADVNIWEMTYLYKNLSRFDKFYFVRNLRQMTGRYPAKKSENSPVISAGNSVAYLKNPTTDAAYTLFSKRIDGLCIAYFTDFRSACESVYYEKNKYCILPLENSSEGRLLGFYNLINKYELKIVLACDIMNPDETVKTHFALCAKYPEKLHAAERQTFEMYVSVKQAEKLCELIMASEYYGLTLKRIDSIPELTPEAGKESYMYITFDGNENAALDFFCYLDIEYTDYTVLGSYPNVDGFSVE